MQRLTLPLFALTTGCVAWMEDSVRPDETPYGGEPRRGVNSDGRVYDPSPAEMPAPPLLPHGIAPQDPYEQDPNADRACHDAAMELATWHQRRGVEAFCKKRSWYARRGAKEPQRWADGSYLHGIDVPVAERAWRRALKAQWIDPEACPLHDKNHAVQMFTRGKWFDLSLYNARHLVTTNTIPCWDPAIMDRTDVGARVVVTRSIKACYRHYKSPCSEENLRRWWKEWIP